MADGFGSSHLTVQCCWRCGSNQICHGSLGYQHTKAGDLKNALSYPKIVEGV